MGLPASLLSRDVLIILSIMESRMRHIAFAVGFVLFGSVAQAATQYTGDKVQGIPVI